MADFTSFSDLRALCLDLPSGHPAASAAVAQREDTLTKPPGSLGRLEELVAWLAHWQGHAPPRLDQVEVLVFAGNHGVTAQGVSAYPAEVTAQMVANFAAGGAAINQLARTAGAALRVIPLVARCADRRFHAKRRRWTSSEFLAAVAAGYDAVSPQSRSRLPRRDGHRQHHGGGGDRRGAVRRRRRALGRPRHRRRRCRPRAQARRHRPRARASRRRARTIRCGSRRRSAAASLPPFSARRWRRAGTASRCCSTASSAPPRWRRSYKLRTDTLAHALAGHVSAEAGHRMLLDALGLSPLLDLDMRLGEGSGAARGAADPARRARLPHRHGDLRRGRRVRQAGGGGDGEGGGIVLCPSRCWQGAELVRRTARITWPMPDARRTRSPRSGFARWRSRDRRYQTPCHGRRKCG